MLDIGCGTGQMTLRFGRKFAVVTAVDHSAAMLDIARAKLAGEPLAFDPAEEPKLAQWWNAPFRAQFAGYSKDAEDSDEGPIPLQLVHQTLAKVGLRSVYERRGRELFPRFGGNLIDRLAIPLLDLFTRKQGVVGMFVVEAV